LRRTERRFGSIKEGVNLKLVQPEYLASTDEALLGMFNNGDVGALEALLSRREKWLWNVAKKSIRDTSLAEEALQEALVLIWKNAHTFRGESQVSSWMYQIVSRACIDALRKEQIRSHASLNELEEFDDIGGSSSFENALVDGLAIHAALLELETEHREVIILLDLESRSVQEASEILGIPVGTVKSRSTRGRAALKQVLTKILSETGNQMDNSNVIPLGVKNGKKR
jgi:RNA polymerase sigma-70 factor (ECF subfamily)